jgi:Helix-turn-helix domain/Domain of unknown function (DUF4115)
LLLVGMTNFGATFKKARESKGISLDQIANQTRISTRFLAAIENEEFQLLPGGIFNRGFVRSFAEAVGIDPAQAVADYERLASIPQPGIDPPAAAAVPPTTERHLYPVAVGILAIAVAIFYLMTRESGQKAVPVPPAPATEPAAQPPSPAPAPEPAPAPSPSPGTQALKLDIQVLEKTWLKVTSDGNIENGGEILEPGMTRKFTADNSLYISIGNAAGLTMKINDKPLRPLGKSGQVRSVTITPANLKDFIG